MCFQNFQLLYAGEGESRKPTDLNSSESQKEVSNLQCHWTVKRNSVIILSLILKTRRWPCFKFCTTLTHILCWLLISHPFQWLFLQLPQPGTEQHKGHDLLPISYHMPTTCEVCTKPLWHMFNPPLALECRSKCEAACKLIVLHLLYAYQLVVFLFTLLIHYSWLFSLSFRMSCKGSSWTSQWRKNSSL